MPSAGGLCAFCIKLDRLRDASSDGPIHIDSTIAAFHRSSRECSGSCKLIYAGILRATTANARRRTRHLLIGGGRKLNSHLRLHATDAGYEDTFKIEFFTDSKSTLWPWAVCLQRVPLPLYSGDEDCLEKLRQWLKACQSSHPVCRVSALRTNVTIRVLELGADNLRLVEGFEVRNSFAALSHCWGDGKHIVTAKQSLSAHKAGIAASSLPRTFRDAVKVCKFIGIKFLWIDSLCIVQDDRRDWEREASKMSVIYQCAEIVLCASAAKDSSEGIFTSRQQPVKLTGSSRTRASMSVALYVQKAVEHTFYTVPTGEDDEREPLTTRAWCLQEWLLAKRTVHFSSTEMVWDCRQEIRCECGVLDMRQSRPNRRNPPDERETLRCRISRVLTRQASRDVTTQDLMKLWEDIVTEYTSRSLTRQTDRLIAISGVAFEVARIVDVKEYVCGLFQKWLPIQIFWKRKDGNRPKSRPEYSIAPSWSWASICDPVEWMDLWPGSTAPIHDLKIIDCAQINIDDDGKNQFGPANGRKLRMRTKLLDGTVRCRTAIDFGECVAVVKVPSTSEDREIFFTLDVDIGMILATEDLSVRFARITVFERLDQAERRSVESQDPSICGSLVLMPSPRSRTHYTRIGVVLGDIEPSWYDEVQDRTFMIV